MLKNKMNSRDRIISVLNHRESDKVPFDLGGTLNTGIHVNSYQSLLSYLNISKSNSHICDIVQQITYINKEILAEFKIDTHGMYPKSPSNWKLSIDSSSDGFKYFTDQYGIKWRMPKGGYYFDLCYSPLSKFSARNLDKYDFPNPRDRECLRGLEEEIIDFYNKGFFIIFNSISGGFLELSLLLRGFENFYCDLVNNPKFACLLMDKLLEIEIEYWDFILSNFGRYIQMVYTANDLGSQNSLLISPVTYRKYIKPRQKELNSFIKKKKPDIFIYFHSCGAIYEIIPDLIEAGVDALNPVQVSVASMDTKKLKKEFGKDISFWGGGVDTQRILPFGTAQEIREEVKKRIDDLAPGGGFVFAAVHNIQADVPPQNIMAMWEALQKYGKY